MATVEDTIDYDFIIGLEYDMKVELPLSLSPKRRRLIGATFR